MKDDRIEGPGSPYRRDLLRWGILAMALCLFAFAAAAVPATDGGQAPPERQEVQAARKIEDLALRIKELERIKAAYPESPMLNVIDRHILDARVNLSETIDAVDALQRPTLSKGKGFDLFDAYYYACGRILGHPHLERFDKARVTAVIESYVAGFLKAASDPPVTADIPADQRRHITSYASSLFLFEAQARLRQGLADKVLETLGKYRDAGAPLDGAYSFYWAEAQALLGQADEALRAYLVAAVDSYKDADAKARALWAKVKGTSDGYDAFLEAKWREPPFHPERFVPPSPWTGKTVLAELFTGSECPPCVAADLGFDGLLEALEPRHLAVLEYHLPIPGPDPMMNPATRSRQDYYGVSSTPTPFFDGERRFPGGGGRDRAEVKFKEYAGEIQARLAADPPLVLKAAAALRGGRVTIECSADKPVAGAAWHVALVEKEVRYRGSNGIVFHKMVVRDLATMTPMGLTSRAAFDLAEGASRALAHLEDYEKERSFRFKEKKAAIGPSGLAIVFFVQDGATKTVLNAVYAEVK